MRLPDVDWEWDFEVIPGPKGRKLRFEDVPWTKKSEC